MNCSISEDVYHTNCSQLIQGNPADPRMKAAALKRGVKLTSISRPIRPSDFEEFDLILAMDKSNRGSCSACVSPLGRCVGLSLDLSWSTSTTLLLSRVNFCKWK